EVPAETLEKEKEILLQQAINEGKPQNIAERMVEGRIKKYYEDNCLLNQKFVKDPDKTISQLMVEATAQIGEKLSIRRFVRFEMGEGIAKKSENLAEEVAKQVAKAQA
ncbi:MAG: translation elongation factor Ts, partial [Alistipes sp.]|nr:translation elongation factor Ts [Alistipes sp.]